MAPKMASTLIFVFIVSHQPFNRFSSNFHQKSRNIFSTYRNLLQLQYGRKQNGVQNGIHLDICVYNITLTVQPIFIKFLPNILKYTYNLWESVIISICQKTKWRPKWLPLDICVCYISSTVQPIFIKFSPKNLNTFPSYRNLM